MDSTDIPTDETPRGLDRRQVIKTAGVLGAAAWAVPAVTSFTSAAHASGSVPTGCTLGEGDTCSNQLVCNDGCFCNANVTDGEPNGTTNCTRPTNCENQLCDNNKDCPAGQVCQATCCGAPRCFEVCTDGAGARAATAPEGGFASVRKR